MDGKLKKFIHLGFIALVAASLASAQVQQTIANSNASSAAPSYSIGNTASAQAGTLQTSVTTGAINITAGQALIGGANGCFENTCATGSGSMAITDSQMDAWVCPAGVGIVVGGGQAGQFCYVCSAVGGSTTFTNTITIVSGTAYYPGLGVAAVNGILSSACGDTGSENATTNTGANPSITSNNVAGSSEFIVGFVSGNVTLTAAQTNIISWNSGQCNLEWTTGPTSGTQAMSWTGSSSGWLATVMGLKHP